MRETSQIRWLMYCKSVTCKSGQFEFDSPPLDIIMLLLVSPLSPSPLLHLSPLTSCRPMYCNADILYLRFLIGNAYLAYSHRGDASMHVRACARVFLKY